MSTLTVANLDITNLTGLISIGLGNTTANLVANSIIVKVANSTSTANLQPTQLIVGTSVVNSTAVTTGTPVINSTTVAVGTSVVNSTAVNAAAVYLGGALVLTASGADQTISGGARVTVNDLGNLSGATITPDPGDRPICRINNNGAGTILPGSNQGCYYLIVTNASGAGAITTTGWTITGDSFDTTITSEFLCACVITSYFSSMAITKVT